MSTTAATAEAARSELGGQFEGELIGRIALDGRDHRMRFKAQRPSEAKVERFGRRDRRFRHHDELAAVRLNAGEAAFALVERLTHVKGFL